MLGGVNDVLTPWTSSRILRIMEAASAAHSVGRGGGDRALPGPTDDGAMAMESLLRLSNQHPDVASRVMAAPLFAQRPLVESMEPASNAAPSSSSSLFYADAHRMCLHTLELCRAGWKHPDATKTSEEYEESVTDRPPASLPPSKPDVVPAGVSPYTMATELEEVAFAAEFVEPCLRGEFPDVRAVVHHSLPAGCTSLLRRSQDDLAKDGKGTRVINAVQRVVQSLLQVPAVSYKQPLDGEGIPATGPYSSIRLNLTRPATAAPSHALLWPSLPQPSTVPIGAYGPPTHKAFDETAVAHTFTETEINDLHAFLYAKPRPLQVYSKAEVQARRQHASLYQCRSAMLSAGVGAGAGPFVGPRATAAGASALHAAPQRSQARASRGADGEHDGWSASSGWSSSNSTQRSGESEAEEEEGNSENRKSARVPDRAADATLLPQRTAVKEEELPAIDESVPPTRPLPNRTWIEDDGDLVLENGKIFVRKRKLKKPPPPLPLPTMVRGSVLRQPKQTTPIPEAVVAAVEEEEANAIVQDVKRSLKGEHIAEEGIDLREERELPATRTRGAAAKRERAQDDGSDQGVQPSTGKPRKRAKRTGAKKSTGKKNFSEDQKTPSTAVLNTTNAPLLSESEMLDFVKRLPISDSLRHALLIGVQSPANAEKEESWDAGEDSASSNASEK
ncbi:hypothetical protein ABL78_3092 [Leptomonas seymouri]|uniref:Uncharacterized protein n=1 Tax=Leptomonas seymouri TaxID=5684 RepID=A0A0N1PE04_LEPSE|nr:hypothetical protein ABL78_3092 [Leptomonas seymouri]|eukprot:KPI87793.1 hypothetical protein ABL78_3092 [Leptomonas seymouri]